MLYHGQPAGRGLHEHREDLRPQGIHGRQDRQVEEGLDGEERAQSA